MTGSFDKIEIVAHGTKQSCGGMNANEIQPVALALAGMLNPGGSIYLTSCLSGVCGDNAIGKIFASYVNCTVVGVCGFTVGTSIVEGPLACSATDPSHANANLDCSCAPGDPCQRIMTTMVFESITLPLGGKNKVLFNDPVLPAAARAVLVDVIRKSVTSPGNSPYISALDPDLTIMFPMHGTGGLCGQYSFLADGQLIRFDADGSWWHSTATTAECVVLRSLWEPIVVVKPTVHGP
jgi:hypothetical protein